MSVCKPPRRPYVSLHKKKCQTFKRHPSWKQWQHSITKGWIQRACKEIGMRSTLFLTEELQGTATSLVDLIQEEPVTLERIRYLFPNYHDVPTEYAVDERMLRKAFPRWSEEVLREVHICLEYALVTMLREGAEIAKANNLKSIQAKHVHAAVMKYYPEDV